MKKILSVLLISLVVLSGCKTKDKDVTKLESLRKERDKIDKAIQELEKIIAAKDTLGNSGHSVKTLVLEPSVFKHFVKVQGRVDGEENVAANAQTIGVVTSILVKTGDMVKKGQVLAQLDDQVLQKAYAEVKTQYDFAKQVYEKQERLYAQKIGSEIQYLTAKNNKEAMENRLKSIKEQLSMYQITSPINGTVEDIAIKVGQAVSPGLPLIRIINLSRMKVVADISESYSSKIKKGDEVNLEFPDLNYATSGTVSFCSKFINPVNRTFAIEVYLTQKDVEFRANTVSILKINDYTAKNALVIPVNVILTDSKGNFVYVTINHSAEKKYITQGKSFNGEVEVTSGLNPGDELIISGYQDLEGGEKISKL